MSGPDELPAPAGLDAVLATHELARRPSRAPDHAAEAQALTELAAALAADPRELLPRLAESVLDVCRAESAGVSVLEEGDGGGFFRWPAVAEEWSRQAGVAVEFQALGLEGERLPPEVETALYRVVQEALTNAAKYAGAGRVSVIVGRRDGHAVAVVEDDGAGFDPDAVSPAAPCRRGGLGLAGMRERVGLLGGEVEVESAPGQGTTVIARIPLGDAPA